MTFSITTIWHNADCHILFIAMLIVIMPIIFMLNVVIQSVMGPLFVHA